MHQKIPRGQVQCIRCPEAKPTDEDALDLTPRDFLVHTHPPDGIGIVIWKMSPFDQYIEIPIDKMLFIQEFRCIDQCIGIPIYNMVFIQKFQCIDQCIPIPIYRPIYRNSDALINAFLFLYIGNHHRNYCHLFAIWSTMHQ